MEILQNGNNPGSSQAVATEEQINFVVHGFVQVWNRFEDSIAREIASRRSLRRQAAESRFGTNLLFRVGTSLTASPSLTMGELSEALSVPLSTATRVVNALVESGYVHRFSDPEDRRVVRVAFAPKGKKLFRFIESQISERVRKIASYLSEEEMTTLTRLLTRVAVAVKEVLN
jgi:DNA-binding MarR family transcriptional regulator